MFVVCRFVELSYKRKKEIFIHKEQAVSIGRDSPAYGSKRMERYEMQWDSLCRSAH